jgi:hypothetical protein
MLDGLEQRWAELVGSKRYAEFRRTLEQIAVS